jgi:chemotaxis response regulator CheB
MTKEKKGHSDNLVPHKKSFLTRRSSNLTQRGLDLLDQTLLKARIRVLIADTNPERRARTRKDIESADDICVIGEAINVKETVEMYEKLRPDVVCMEIDKHIQDWVTTTEIICKKHKDARIIALSYYLVESLDVRRLVRASERSAVDFYPRPYDVPLLIDGIRSLVRFF